MFQQGGQAKIISVKKVNKFKFQDYQLAQYVRGSMLQILRVFDVNKDKLFQKQQIMSALRDILNEDESQLQYVVRNVFRYDKDNDGAVTHQQFVDFSVEQHFGEMAIQRLHRTKVYSQGAKRIMNLEEFIKTLEYSLNKINISSNNQIYAMLFSQVDLDRDGFITYQDYFSFLKEYFGTQSAIYDNVSPRHPQQPNFKVDQHAVHRFARLIYNQMKMTVIKNDKGRKMNLNRAQIKNMLGQLLQLNEEDKNYLANLTLQDKQSIGYGQFLLLFVPFYFCEYVVSVYGIGGQVINREAFVHYLTQASSAIVAIPPTQNTLLSIFYLITKFQKDLSAQEYVQLMAEIFENFHLDERGLKRAH